MKSAVVLVCFLSLWANIQTVMSNRVPNFVEKYVQYFQHNSKSTSANAEGIMDSESEDLDEIEPRNGNSQGTRLRQKEKCLKCIMMALAVYEMARTKMNDSEIVHFATRMCIDSMIFDERICTDLVPEYKDMALAVFRRDVLRPDQLCGIIYGPSCSDPSHPTEMWNVTLPNTPKPPVKPPRPPAPGSPKKRFLQLTDVHIDLMYEEGRSALCGEPLCCRSNDAMPEPGVPGAGVWGDYRHCDVPLSLIDNLFKHLANKSDQFDFIIFTGDIAAHDIWNQSRSDQITALERLVSYFEKYLPGKPVYFTAGNHDTAPCNSFPPPFITGNNSQEWMYKAMADNWSKWLPADTKETILSAGYYTVSPYPGFRIISVNNNFCHMGNWWLFLNDTDPAGVLYWLGQTLQQAEDKGEKVYIIQHHPTDCMVAWSWNFYRIVNRYESTIIGQFNGHTHNDEFRMYYDEATLSRPLNVAYVGGAVTTFHDRNPNYRIYTMDGFYSNSSFAVLDYEDYIFNITKNNKLTDPLWELEYSPLSEYGMKGVNPSDWNDLINRMKTDDNLFNKFHLHMSKGGDTRSCNQRCRRKKLCRLKSGRSDDPRLCADL